jgi:hypothetical protein
MSSLSRPNLVEGVMSKRLVHLLLLASGLYTAGAVIVLFSGGVATPRPLLPAQAPQTGVAHVEQAARLPVVAERAAPVIPTLATITVHPVQAHDGIARVREFALGAASAATSGPLVALPGSSFDMPYYSFGKSLRRVSKE